jgi:hypothetical protein
MGLLHLQRCRYSLTRCRVSFIVRLKPEQGAYCYGSVMCTLRNLTQLVFQITNACAKCVELITISRRNRVSKISLQPR